jgi:2-dehydropantoate 2-reductase
VKSYSTEEAGRALKPLLGEKGVVVTLQNGVGNVETLGSIFGRERVLGGVTAEGATLLGPGRIRHAGHGETFLGPAGGPGAPAELLASALNSAGFKSRTVEDVDNLIWGKLIVNVGINALAAILRVRNGLLPDLAGARSVMEDAVKEAVAVAGKKGIRLPYADPMGRVVEVCRATAGNVASMLQDVLKQKPTEVDFINGAVVREGDALGVPTPVNRTLTSIVKAVQESYRERL